LEGGVAVFGWRPGPAPAVAADPLRRRQVDLDRLAFRPGEHDRAPRAGPDHDPEERSWWEAFYKPAPPRTADRDQAALHLLQAEALRRAAPYRHLAAWDASQSAGVVGAAGGWPGPAGLLDAYQRLVLLRPVKP